MTETGSRAPDFSLRDQDGNLVSLADLEGQTSVLVFYPLDFSPGCTDQLSIYQEVLAELEAEGACLYGISVDSAFCHKAFRKQQRLTFPLLADFEPKGETARRYGMYIAERGHNERGFVVIGRDLVVKHIHRSPSALEIPGANLIFDALIA